MNLVEIIITLIALRKQQGHTAETVALAIGVSSSSMYRWESFACSPSMDNVGRYADYLGYKLALVTLDTGAIIKPSPHVGETFQAIRERLRLTASTVAQKAGISRSTVFKIENTESGNNLYNVIALANVLGYSLTLIKKEQE